MERICPLEMHFSRWMRMRARSRWTSLRTNNCYRSKPKIIIGSTFVHFHYVFNLKRFSISWVLCFVEIAFPMRLPSVWFCRINQWLQVDYAFPYEFVQSKTLIDNTLRSVSVQRIREFTIQLLISVVVVLSKEYEMNTVIFLRSIGTMNLSRMSRMRY